MYREPVHKKLIMLLIMGIFSMGMAYAQITSSTASRVDSLAYPVKEGKDPIFIFYQSHGTFRPGTLNAAHPGGGTYTIQWSRYNPDADGFDAPFQTENGVASSTASGLGDGLYRASFSGGTGSDTDLFAWVMLDDFLVSQEKTSEDRIWPVNYRCNFLVLKGNISPDTLLYYDPVSHVELKEPLDFSFKWTSDNDDLTIPSDSTNLEHNINRTPPTKDTWFILTGTDRFGMSERDSAFYESIETLAEFSVEYYDKVGGEWVEDLQTGFVKGEGSMDAPLSVRFINESENGETYTWVFVDTTGTRIEEITYDTDAKPEFTYEAADEYYYPSLHSVSEAGCEDSLTLEEGIYVQPSQLSIPNVFSPDGDGTNDLFIFKHQSLKTCKLTIVDRTGKVVYKKEIDDIYAWEGWDGNIKDSDRKAPEGQYYYVIDALGYDGKEFKDPTLWSQMKLFGGGGTGKTGTSGTGGTGTTGTEEAPLTIYTGWLYLFRSR